MPSTDQLVSEAESSGWPANMDGLKVSILVPVFNEFDTIIPLLEKVLASCAGVDKEVLVCDDGSTDGTRDLLSDIDGESELTIEYLDENIGRGGVLKHLWTRASGQVIVHQDADLEYDPAEISLLLAPIVADEADVVFGSRFKGSIEKMRGPNAVGNRLMSWSARRLYGLEITDLMTCYKAYRSEFIADMSISANGFDFEAELTARLAQQGARFAEVPISFVGRTVDEGKKIRMVDALHVMRRLVACRQEAGSSG